MTPQEAEPKLPLVLGGLLWRCGQQGLTTGTEALKVPLWSKPSSSLPLTLLQSL